MFSSYLSLSDLTRETEKINFSFCSRVCFASLYVLTKIKWISSLIRLRVKTRGKYIKLNEALYLVSKWNKIHRYERFINIREMNVWMCRMILYLCLNLFRVKLVLQTNLRSPMIRLKFIMKIVYLNISTKAVIKGYVGSCNVLSKILQK